jgi:hypothetical protein
MSSIKKDNPFWIFIPTLRPVIPHRPIQSPVDIDIEPESKESPWDNGISKDDFTMATSCPCSVDSQASS